MSPSAYLCVFFNHNKMSQLSLEVAKRGDGFKACLCEESLPVPY